ncbi:P-loop containing nucleoside triphosphate hydrolase protein [Biscogniauxia marginata]|nr:P-loop containing nucleoside triphosphate hydrolase protein [Biscogniauxia marginata]
MGQTQAKPGAGTSHAPSLPIPRPRSRNVMSPMSTGTGYGTTVETVTSPSTFRNQETEELIFERQFIREKSALRIVCPKLIDALNGATIGYSNVYRKDAPFSPTTSIDEPYKLIFYNREKLSQAVHKSNEERTAAHIKTLLEFLKDEHPHIWEKLDEIKTKDCNEIAFDDLWVIYPPGTTVLRKDDGGWRAYKVQRVEVSVHSDTMLIYCYFLDFDKTGRRLVPQLEVLQVPSYSSTRTIGSLEVVPEWFFDHHNGFREKLLKRGDMYWNYNGDVFYYEYHGDAWPRTQQNDRVKVIVDYVTDSKHEQDQAYTNLGTDNSCAACIGEVINLNSYPSRISHDPDVCARRVLVDERPERGSNDSKDSLLFCPSRVWAFSMKHKSWKMVLPQDLTKVQAQEGGDDALKQLWMDSDHKKLLESTLLAHLKNRSGTTNIDFIKGKGNGLNILLHGGPGTGKTLTAEKYGVPLYTVTCTDLRADLDILEQQLRTALLRATNWRAILLLDDADIFLQNRDQFSLKRNIAVSIFLHHLDYSEALLFMTTTHIAKFDRGIDSRIHIMLELPQFDFNVQKIIWTNLIQRLENLTPVGKQDLELFIRDDLESLDQGMYTSMNGRQIRNCISAALALVHNHENNLRTHHIKEILRLYKGFRDFMSQPPAQLNRNRGLHLTQGFAQSR